MKKAERERRENELEQSQRAFARRRSARSPRTLGGPSGGGRCKRCTAHTLPHDRERSVRVECLTPSICRLLALRMPPRTFSRHRAPLSSHSSRRRNRSRPQISPTLAQRRSSVRSRVPRIDTLVCKTTSAIFGCNAAQCADLVCDS